MHKFIAQFLTAGLLITTATPQVMAQQTANTDATLGAGGWVDQGDGTNLHLAIDEATANDTDYIWSDIDTQTAYLGLTSLNDPNSSTGHILKFRAWGHDKAGQPGQLRLYENSGNTLIATYSFTIATRRAWTDLTLVITLSIKIGKLIYLTIQRNSSF